jgi:hypothetical protein
VTERDDQKLRAFFREVHEQIDPPAPPYGSVIRPGRGASPVRAVATLARVGATLARTLGVLVVSGALLLVMRGWSMRDPGDDEAMRLASELGKWEAPTDFLLQTPGIELLQSPPQFGAGTDELPGDRPDLIPEEVSR